MVLTRLHVQSLCLRLLVNGKRACAGVSFVVVVTPRKPRSRVRAGPGPGEA